MRTSRGASTFPRRGRRSRFNSPRRHQPYCTNGLTLILSERRGLPIVAANLVIKTGSDANPIERPGLANFVAAMLDEGTASRNALQIADEVSQLGATLTTNSSMDATTISARSLSKNFAATLGLVADITLKPSFPAEEIDRQRASRLGQLVQMRDSPAQVAAQVMGLVLYGPKHPYGYTELGTEASMKAVARDEMMGFWRQHFIPNNSALIVAGDISMSELRGLAEKAFASWPRGNSVQPSLGAPDTTRARIVIVDKPGAPQTQVRVAGIGAARSSPDFRALQVMNNALGGLFSSRINMNLREEHGYTYGASSQFIFRRECRTLRRSGRHPHGCDGASRHRDLQGDRRNDRPADDAGRALEGQGRARQFAARCL